jgi:flagellar hook-length control protein FliK
MSRQTAGIGDLTAVAGRLSSAERGVKTRLRSQENEPDRDRGERRESRITRIGPRVEVRDLRAQARDAGNHDSEASSRRHGATTESLSERLGMNRPEGTAGEHDQAGTFKLETSSSANGTARTLDTSGRSADLPAQLRQALHEHVNGEIVRSARLVVRGGESGEIRLHLRPEELGSVRISLHMQDGHIAGRIMVDNQTVREVFEQNLAALQRAFEESGLEASGVEVSVADSGGQHDGGESSASRATRGQSAARFGHVVPDLGSIEEIHELVDMVV